MNRTERLNDMIRFLNRREFFNLVDLMNEYNISKSTALRDISSLEEIGMPLYSEHGRNGRYGILKNRVLSATVFTLDEMYALYFSMLSLEAYQSTPFHIKIQKLKGKYGSCLTNLQRLEIDKMKKVVKFESTKHYNDSPFLEQVLESIINETSCKINYLKQYIKTYHVQFFRISTRFGQWYMNGIDIDTNQIKTFRCDKISSFETINVDTRFTLDELLQKYESYQKNENSIQFEVEIKKQASDIYQKNNYANMSIEYGLKTVIHGLYKLT